MTRRPSTLFRGSEFARLLLLAAIALAGWPMVLLFARSNQEPKPAPPPPLLASKLVPFVADSGVEFQALVDKVPMQSRENAAYATLLERTRRAPSTELAATSRRDLLFTHLWERPERYRGVPVHIEGTALRVLSYEVNPALAPSGRIYEAWVYSDDNRAFPYVLAFDEPPPGLVVGSELYLKVRFDGYFLKLLGYRAGDKWRAAPMLVGHVELKPQAAEPPAPMVEVRDLFRRNGLLVGFVLLFGYLVIRGAIQIRRLTAPARRLPQLPSRSLSPTEISPEELSQWLATLPESEPEDRDPANPGDPDRASQGG